MRGRIQEEDQSAAQRDRDYFYYSRTLEGKQYKVICRRRVPAQSGPPSGNELTSLGHFERYVLNRQSRLSVLPGSFTTRLVFSKAVLSPCAHNEDL